MDWKTMLSYISGSVDEELLLPSLDTSNLKRPGAPILSSFVFLDTTG